MKFNTDSNILSRILFEINHLIGIILFRMMSVRYQLFKKYNLVAIALILLVGCQSQHDKSSVDLSPQNYLEEEIEPPLKNLPPTPIPAKDKVETPNNISPRKIIKNANIRLQVENVDNSTSTITLLTEQYNGFIAGMDLANNNREISNKIQVKIPANNFEPFINKLSKEAVFIAHKKINTSDVTEEYIDLQSRLKTKKEVKEKYAKILRSKTKTIEEVMNAEEMIRKLQEEIESAEGRLRYLGNQSALSTIMVDIYEPKEYEHEPVVYKDNFWVKLWEGFENGWSAVTSVVLFFVNIWPVVFIGIFVFWRRKKLFNKIGFK